MLRTTIQKILKNETKVKRHGTLSEKILLEIEMMTSVYEHLEVIVQYYDDPDRPDFTTWIDVEGMGYGWAWTAEEEDESKWHGIISSVIKMETTDLFQYINEGYYLVIEREREDSKVLVYQIVYYNFLGDKIEVFFTFSQEELFY